MTEKSHIPMFFAQFDFRALQEFDNTDVLLNVVLLQKVAIFFV